MKLQHFAIGDRFEYEGRIFVKTGPMTASAEQGGQQLIPRYAVLKPLTPGIAPESGHGRLERKTVIAAFEHFYQTSERLCAPDEREELAEARKTFLAALG